MFLFIETKLVFKNLKESKDKTPVSVETSEKPKSKKEELLERKKKAQQAIREKTKRGLENIKLTREAKKYMRSFNKEQIKAMLAKSASMSIFDLRRGGTLRLKYQRETDPKKKAKLKGQLSENQGYAQMTAQFAKEKIAEDGRMYLEVDLKGIDRYELKLGAGHICPPSWVKVAIEDTNGNKKIGYRRVPGIDKGIYGTKIGYYTSEGEYLPVYSGYKIYPLEIKDDPNQLQKEENFYNKGPKEVADRGVGLKGVSTSKDYKRAIERLSGSNKSELAAKGITPFPVRIGYQMTPEEKSIYMREYKEARRLSRMTMEERMAIMQERYHLKDAIDLAFRALNLPEKYRKYFYAYNDAVMYIESRYNPIAVNRKNGKIALSTATGAYQILNSVWKSSCDKWLRDTKKSRYYRRYYASKVPSKYQINFDLLRDVDFSQPLPGLATPYQHAIFHNIYVFLGSRLYRGSMAFDEVFEKLQSGSLSPEMKYSYQAYLYTNWRNGHGGAKVFLQMMRRGIPFPRDKAEAKDYFEQMPNCWQKRRGFNDFYRLVRACKAFVGRFNKNLREQEA